MPSCEGYFGVYFPSCEATREINTKKPSVGRIKCSPRQYTHYSITYTAWGEHKWRSKRLFSKINVSLLLWLRSDDDVRTDCARQRWWSQLWDALVKISNSLHIDFIRCDIQDRSCKNFAWGLSTGLKVMTRYKDALGQAKCGFVGNEFGILPSRLH